MNGLRERLGRRHRAASRGGNRDRGARRDRRDQARQEREQPAGGERSQELAHGGPSGYRRQDQITLSPRASGSGEASRVCAHADETSHMCRLFGMSGGPERVRATFWLLEAPDSLAQQSRREPDGTGLGFYEESGAPVMQKQPLAAYEDHAFAHAAREACSRTFVAHVRYPST